MVSENVFVKVAPGSLTRASNVNVPEVAGVPLTTPAALSVTPEGNAPPCRFHDWGAVPPLALNAWL